MDVPCGGRHHRQLRRPAALSGHAHGRPAYCECLPGGIRATRPTKPTIRSSGAVPQHSARHPEHSASRPLRGALLFLAWYTGGMRYLLPLLFLACAPPREYRDGARLPPAEPRTTYAPTGTGLPEYWGRPERKPDVEPNPKPTRLLPPSMEPGIWAASEPTDPRVSVLETWIPVPSVDDDDGRPLAAIHCTDAIDVTFRDDAPELWIGAAAVTEEDRACLAALVFHACIADLRASMGDDGLGPLIGDATTHVARKCTSASRKRLASLFNRARPKIAKWKGATH